MQTSAFVSSSVQTLHQGCVHTYSRRQQYTQEAHSTPTFARLYNVRQSLNRAKFPPDKHPSQLLISIEKEIEDSLPQFQDLLLSLTSVFHHRL